MPSAVIKYQRHIRQALAIRQQTVVVRIQPHQALQRDERRGIQAGIRVFERFARSHTEDAGQPRVCVGVTIPSIVVSLISGSETVTRGRPESDDIISRGQPRKLVESAGICAGRPQKGRSCIEHRTSNIEHRTSAVIEFYLNPGNSRLICILNTILICVMPYEIADARRDAVFRNEHAGIRCRIVLTC